jgi:hypothetical protein
MPFDRIQRRSSSRRSAPVGGAGYVSLTMANRADALRIGLALACHGRGWRSGDSGVDEANRKLACGERPKLRAFGVLDSPSSRYVFDYGA